jgi:predicted nucleic acid-binding protein
MILVDTNVWSEAFRPRPDERVRQWAGENAHRLWLSTVVIGELLSGAALLPEGRRRAKLLEGYRELIESNEDRIAPFDLDASQHYGVVVAEQTRAGRNPGTADSQIAATARARGMSLATRNTKHFEGLGLVLIDPWAA